MDEQEKLHVLITPDHTIIGREDGFVIMDFAPARIVVELPNSERLPIGDLIDYYRKYIDDKIKSI